MSKYTGDHLPKIGQQVLCNNNDFKRTPGGVVVGYGVLHEHPTHYPHYPQSNRTWTVVLVNLYNGQTVAWAPMFVEDIND